MNKEDRDLILQYFNPIQPFDFFGSTRYSTLIAGLRDSRACTKRDLLSGKYNPNANEGDEGNWLGAIGYFTILDQIGSCYKPSGVENIKHTESSIKYAIEHFAYGLIQNNERKLSALIALRNAFTHDFNLLNIPRDRKKVSMQQHKFTVMSDIKSNWVVKLPLSLWDGNIESKKFNDTSDNTFINLFGFGNLVESIHTLIYDMISKDQLELQLPINKLINKYTFILL